LCCLIVIPTIFIHEPSENKHVPRLNNHAQSSNNHAQSSNNLARSSGILAPSSGNLVEPFHKVILSRFKLAVRAITRNCRGTELFGQ